MDSIFLAITVVCGLLWRYQSTVSLGTAVDRQGEGEEDSFHADQIKKVALYRDLFVAFAVIFVVRAFFFEWFTIPSSSMEPALSRGDYVMVDKNQYGFRLPVLGFQVTSGVRPDRGEIVIFRHPNDESTYYIKRIIGLPGDTLRYRADGSIVAGDELWRQEESGLLQYSRNGRITTGLLLWEQIPTKGWHPILHDDDIRQHGSPLVRSPFCRISTQSLGAWELVCEVPEGGYFVMGDNRHHSNDSRNWGFVPEDNIVGPAFRVILNWRQLSRFWESLALFDDPNPEFRAEDR